MLYIVIYKNGDYAGKSFYTNLTLAKEAVRTFESLGYEVTFVPSSL